MKPLCSMREALADPNLLGNSLQGDSFALWRTMLMALRGEPLLPEELDALQSVTGRPTSPTAPVEEAALIVGRRGGKDRAISVLNAYLAGCVDYSDVLSKGERGIALILAPDTRQSRIQLDYVEGVLNDSPVLSKLVTGRTAEVISLSNGIDIEVKGANYRRIRGVSAISVTASEAAFWYNDEFSSNADVEILNAARPSLSTTGGPLLIISSPYARRGELFELWRKHYGPEGDPAILVARAPSRTFNPILPERVIQRALDRDFAVGSSEYLAEWRSDVEALISREAIEAVTDTGVIERAPLDNVIYQGFTDMAGGSGSDSATLAIGHLEGRVAIVDAVREMRPRFSPESCIAEFSELLKRYRVGHVTGDRWAGDFPKEAYARHGITYMAALKTASDIYGELLPRINSGEARLLDNQRLLAQLVALERKSSRTGKDSISHPPGQHDDLANSCAGVIWQLAAQPAPVHVIPFVACTPRSWDVVTTCPANPKSSSPYG